MKLAHIGTFDVESYGDLLFPLVLEKRMAEVCIDCIHVSPKRSQLVWQDCRRTISISDIPEIVASVNAVVLGGGHIVRAHPTSLPFYLTGGCDGLTSYPSLWLGAAELAISRGLPLCWNAPGVPRRFSTRCGRLVRWACSTVEYLAVRDLRSRDLLRAAGVERPIHVVPDTALEVSRLWSNREIDSAYKDAFARRGLRIPERSMAVHVKARYVSEPMDILAARIDRIAKKLNLVPILIAMSPCHGDADLQHLIAKQMTTSPLLVEPTSLCEVAACIGRSQLYIGSSLHGAITAISFKVSAVVVADEDAAGFAKFSGFLEQIGLTEILCKSWNHAERCVGSIQRMNQQNIAVELAWSILDDHWTRLKAAVLMPAKRQSRTNQNGAPQHCVILEQMPERIREKYIPSIDLIVCVHNALTNVALCLDSVRRNTKVGHKLFIVNDGSSEKTSRYLRTFVSKHGGNLIENSTAVGYTRAANMALRTSTGEYIILLNSDVIVPDRWIERLLECIESDPDVGIVGPLSNAAGWQSVPQLFDDNGDWMVNELPEGVTTDTAAVIVESISLRRYPKVPVLNGFCLLIKREVVARIGLFDAESFPDGYGEEVDFCIRAGRAGIGMAVADHGYVFHFKSRSYGHKRRRKLTAKARLALETKYGATTMSNIRENLRNNDVLTEARRQIAEVFDRHRI